MNDVTIVGGGIASLLLGCELAGTRPVTLITADDPARAGGHLASWDEAGYPVEHGFHALFRCYGSALALLGRHGLRERFVEAPDHFLLDDGARLHRVRNGWRTLLPPLGWRDRARGLAGVRAALPAVLGAARGDEAALAALDGEDFRDALLRMGFPHGFVRSPVIQMFYDFGFTGEGRLSAAVALTVMARLVEGGRMLHFPGPARDVVIDPLRRRFVARGGRLVDATRLDAILHDGARVARIAVTAGGESRELPVGELVLAVDVEAFKRLAWRGAPKPAFAAAVDRLDGLASLSLQAWFPDDPVPAAIDQVIGGLPEPWSTLCPVTRVRGGGPSRHGYELIACGPETGFEAVSDGALVDRFFAVIARLGMRVPPGRRGVHVVIRRNRAPGERYLATRPGELALRPAPVTPLANLSLAGAWTRVAFSMPSMEAAAQSVERVRDALARRRAAAAIEVRALPPYPAPPYRHEGTLRLFRVRVDDEALAARLPDGLVLAPGWTRHALAMITDYTAWPVADPSRGFPVQELGFAAVAGEPRRAPGLAPFALFLDCEVAAMAGRELYGFPKRLARVAIGDRTIEVTREGTRDGLIARGRWRREAPAGNLGRLLDGLWPTGALAAALAMTGGVALYNRAAAHPGGVLRPALTRALAHAVVLGTPVRLADAQLELGTPLRDLIPSGTMALTSALGIEVPLAFTLAAPERVSRAVRPRPMAAGTAA